MNESVIAIPGSTTMTTLGSMKILTEDFGGMNRTGKVRCKATCCSRSFCIRGFSPASRRRLPTCMHEASHLLELLDLPCSKGCRFPDQSTVGHRLGLEVSLR